MIELTRLNGTSLWLNPFLIEAVAATPDCVITLTNGHKYVVRETPFAISALIRNFLSEVGLIGKLYLQKDDGS